MESAALIHHSDLKHTVPLPEANLQMDLFSPVTIIAMLNCVLKQLAKYHLYVEYLIGINIQNQLNPFKDLPHFSAYLKGIAAYDIIIYLGALEIFYAHYRSTTPLCTRIARTESYYSIYTHLYFFNTSLNFSKILFSRRDMYICDT